MNLFRTERQEKLITKYRDLLTRRTFNEQEFIKGNNIFDCAFLNGINYLRLFENIYAVDEENPMIGKIFNRKNNKLNLVQEIHQEHANAIINNFLDYLPNGTEKLIMGSDVCGLFILNEEIKPVDFSIVEEHNIDTKLIGLPYKVQPAIYTPHTTLYRKPLFVLDHSKVGNNLLVSLDSNFNVIAHSR